MSTSTKSPVKYLDVYNDLKNAIISGKYFKGVLLPTENELTEIYSASRTTIRRAISMLQQDGLVSVRQGRGTEVTGGAKPALSGSYLMYSNISGVKSIYNVEGEAVYLPCTVDTDIAHPGVAAALNIAGGSVVYRIQRMRIINDLPVRYIVSYVPTSLAPGLEAYSGQTFLLQDLLWDSYGIKHISQVEKISAAAAGFLEANLLNVEVGAPLLVTSRTMLGRNGITEYTKSYSRPDLYQIVVSMNSNDYHDEYK